MFVSVPVENTEFNDFEIINTNIKVRSDVPEVVRKRKEGSEAR